MTEQKQALKEESERRRTAKAERDEVITVLAKAGFTTVQIAAKTEITTATVLASMKRLGIRTVRSRWT